MNRFEPGNEAEGTPVQPEREPDSSDTTRNVTPLRKLIRRVVIVLVILIVLRAFVFTPYSIPTGSMSPTIQEGDAILVNTFTYYIRTPDHIPFTAIEIPQLEIAGPSSLNRGDVVVFDATVHRRRYGNSNQLVKRCVALPGDTVQIVDGILLVNGRPPESTGTGAPMNPDRAFELLRRNRRVTVPYKGLQIPLDSVSVEAWRPVIESEGVSIDYRNSIVFLNGRPATFYRFKRDYFFAAGDNSGDSFDSRFFGFVPRENLIGRGMFVYWSRDPYDGIRWGRIGTWID